MPEIQEITAFLYNGKRYDTWDEAQTVKDYEDRVEYIRSKYKPLYGIEECGLWKVYNEDMNMEKILYGSFHSVTKYAAGLLNFYYHDSPGEIKKLNVIDV